MNIGSLLPPVNTAKLKQPKRSEIAVAGSEITKEPPRYKPDIDQDDEQQEEQSGQERRHSGKDRRQKNIKPLVDMRSGVDRRKGTKSSINIDV